MNLLLKLLGVLRRNSKLSKALILAGTRSPYFACSLAAAAAAPWPRLRQRRQAQPPPKPPPRLANSTPPPRRRTAAPPPCLDLDCHWVAVKLSAPSSRRKFSRVGLRAPPERRVRAVSGAAAGLPPGLRPGLMTLLLAGGPRRRPSGCYRAPHCDCPAALRALAAVLIAIASRSAGGGGLRRPALHQRADSARTIPSKAPRFKHAQHLAPYPMRSAS